MVALNKNFKLKSYMFSCVFFIALAKHFVIYFHVLRKSSFLYIHQVHSGFLNAYDSVRNRIMALIKFSIGYL